MAFYLLLPWNCRIFTVCLLVLYVSQLFNFLLLSQKTFRYHDYPSKNPHVSAIELEKIERGKEKEQLELNSYVPYWVIQLKNY